MAEAVGAVHYDISASTAKMEAGLKKARAHFNGFQRAGQSAAAGMTAALTRIGGAMAGALAVERIIMFTGQSIAAAAALGRLANQAGVSSTQIQGLEHALRDTGLSQTDMATALATLNRNLSDLQRGTGEFFSTLRSGGADLVATFRGVTDADEAFGKLADVLARMPNASDRTRLAMAALGESGARASTEMARLGSDGLRRAREEAIALGVVMDERIILAAREMETRFNELANILSSVFTTAVVRAAEALRLLSATEAQRRQQLAGDRAELDGIEARFAAGTVQRHERNALLQRQAGLLRRVVEEEMRLASIAPPPTTTGAPVKLDTDALARAQEQLAAFNDRLQGTPVLFDQSGLAAITYGERVAEAMRLVEAATKDSGAVAAAQASMRLRLARQEQDAILDTASTAAQTITALWPKSKAAAIASATINTMQGVTKALSAAPPPLNFVNAALVAAAGMAQIRAITSTNLSGGGSVPSVGGGSAGAVEPAEQAPSQAISLNIAPGMYSADQVAGLMEQMNQHVRDGATLISTQIK